MGVSHGSSDGFFNCRGSRWLRPLAHGEQSSQIRVLCTALPPAGVTAAALQATLPEVK